MTTPINIFETKTPSNIFELLEHLHVRKYPFMYFRGNRILDVVKFIDAYCICEMHNNLDTGIIDYFNKLTFHIHEEMARKFPDKQYDNFHWYQMIETLADGDFDREIPIFIELYDKYKLTSKFDS